MKKILLAIASVVLACGIGFAAVGCGGGDEYAINVSGGGSSVGISGAANGTLDLGMASKEVDGAEEGVEVLQLCLDGIAVVVNNSNTAVTNLTEEQLLDIYTGDITNWSAVGGSNAAISVMHREDGSGTRDAFLELVGFDEETMTLVGGAGTHSSTSVMMEAVAGDVNAIGYISLGSLDSTVKAVQVNGVEATVANVLNNSYSLKRPFNVMYLESTVSSNALLADFLKFLESSQAQDIIEEDGYISTRADAAAYTVPETKPDVLELNVGGSTSVQDLMVALGEAYAELLNA